MTTCTDNPRLGLIGCGATYGGERQHSVARVAWSAHDDGRAHITGALSTISDLWRGDKMLHPADRGFVELRPGYWGKEDKRSYAPGSQEPRSSGPGERQTGMKGTQVTHKPSDGHTQDERATVPEILGWKWKTLEGRRWLCPPDTASTSVAAVSPEAARITVDDMLAWLLDRLGWERFGIEISEDGYRIVMDIDDGEFGEVLCPEDAPAPTLHEALSAAVLAVAERKEPTDDR